MHVAVSTSVNTVLLLLLVSEPSLKMRSSKLSLRQKVMQKNSRLMRRREVYRKHVPAAGVSVFTCILHMARASKAFDSSVVTFLMESRA